MNKIIKTLLFVFLCCVLGQEVFATGCIKPAYTTCGSGSITNVTINQAGKQIYSRTSPFCELPLADVKRSATPNLYKGLSYDFITKIYKGGKVAVYVDMDADGLFGSMNDLFFNLGTGGTAGVTATIPIPLAFPKDSIKVRIMSTSDNYTYSTTSTCNTTFAEGELEDYSFNVLSCPNYAVNAGPNDTLCSGQIKSLIGAVDAKIKSPVISWTPSKLLASPNTINTNTFALTGTDVNFAFTLNVTDPATGCQYSDQTVVTVNPALTSVYISGANVACSSNGALITATDKRDGNANFKYQWYDPAGKAITGATTKDLLVKASGLYKCTFGYAKGCATAASATYDVTISPSPTVPVLSSASKYFCEGQSSLVINSNVTDKTLSLQWFKVAKSVTSGFEFLQVINGQTSPNLTITDSGRYALRATSGNGCSVITPVYQIIGVASPFIDIDDFSYGFCPGKKDTLTTYGFNANTSTFQWYSGGSVGKGTPIAGATQTSYITAQAGYYYVEAKDKITGCIGASTYNPYVSQYDTVQPVISVSSACDGSNVKLVSNVSSTNGYTNNWYYKTYPGIPGGPNQDIHTPTVAGKYFLEIVTSNGCKTVTSKDVTLTITKLVYITAPKTALCPTDYVVLSVNNPNATTFVWTDPSGASTAATTSSYYYVYASTAGFAGKYKVDVTLYDPIKQQTCYLKDSITITALAAPVLKSTDTVRYVGNPIATCADLNATLSIPTISGAVKYTWFEDSDGRVAVASGATLTTFTPKFSSYYGVEIYGANGCYVVSNEIHIKDVIKAPTLVSNRSFGDPTALCTGDSVSLTASNQDYNNYGNLKLTLEKSSVIIATGIDNQGYPGDIDKYIKTSGTYIAKVKTIDAQACEASSPSIIIKDIVVTANAGADVTACQNTNVKLSAKQALNYSYSWKNSFGQFILSQTPDLNVSSGVTSSTYVLTVSDTIARCSSQDQVTVNVQPSFILTVDTLGASCFNGLGSATLKISPTGGTYNYFWSDNTISTTATTVPIKAGKYSVIAKNIATGCTDTATSVVINNGASLATPQISSPFSSFCQGGSVAITVNNFETSKIVSKIELFRNDTLVATTNTPSVPFITSVNKGGNYTAKITTSAGCEMLSSILPITVLPNPIVNFSTAKAITACAYQSLTLSSAVGVNYTYSWFDGKKVAGTTNSLPVVVNPTAAAKYILTVTDGATKCTSKDSITVTSFPVFNLAFKAYNVKCSGGLGSVKLLVGSAKAPFNFAWSDNTISPTLDSVSVKAGTYSVIATNGDGCKDTVSNIVINNAPISNIIIDSISGTPITCPKGTTGGVVVRLRNVIGKPTITWTGTVIKPKVDTILAGVGAGVYSINVQDGQSCQARVFTFVNPTPLNAGAISSKGKVFSGFVPPSIKDSISISGGITPRSIKWIQSEGCTSTWDTIVGATSATYSPAALTKTTCYQRVAINSCGTILSNVATYTVIAQPKDSIYGLGAIGSNITIELKRGQAPWTVIYQIAPATQGPVDLDTIVITQSPKTFVSTKDGIYTIYSVNGVTGTGAGSASIVDPNVTNAFLSAANSGVLPDSIKVQIISTTAKAPWKIYYDFKATNSNVVVKDSLTNITKAISYIKPTLDGTYTLSKVVNANGTAGVVGNPSSAVLTQPIKDSIYGEASSSPLGSKVYIKINNGQAPWTVIYSVTNSLQFVDLDTLVMTQSLQSFISKKEGTYKIVSVNNVANTAIGQTIIFNNVTTTSAIMSGSGALGSSTITIKLSGRKQFPVTVSYARPTKGIQQNFKIVTVTMTDSVYTFSPDTVGVYSLLSVKDSDGKLGVTSGSATITNTTNKPTADIKGDGRFVGAQLTVTINPDNTQGPWEVIITLDDNIYQTVILDSLVFTFETAKSGVYKVKSVSGNREGNGAIEVLINPIDTGAVFVWNAASPDGDGKNDQVIVQIPKWVKDKNFKFSLVIFDREGTFLRKLENVDVATLGLTLSGDMYEYFWDCTNEDKEVLPPGTYFYSFKINEGSESEQKRANTSGFIELRR